MTTDITTPGGGGPIGPVAGLDVRQMMRKMLAPYKTIEPWHHTLEKHCFDVRNADGAVTKIYPWAASHRTIDEASEIKDAIGYLPDVWDAQAMIEEAMTAPSEEIVRTILVAMFLTMRSKATEHANVFVDTLVFELTEPQIGKPICAPAIAAAVRETWNAQTFAPSVHEFMTRARKHQDRIETIRKQLNWLSDAYCAASDMIDPPKGDEECELTF